MYERLKEHTPLPESISAADEALFSGRPDIAKIAILDAIQTQYAHDPRAYHHLAMKAVALRLYELIYTRPTPERIRAARKSVYTHTASLIESELASPDAYSTNREVKTRLTGRLSEDIVLGLHNSGENSQGILVPAKQLDDIAHQKDFVYFPPHETKDPEKYVQVKTRSSPPMPEGITLINMVLVDPDFDGHELHDSLARTMVRDASGKGTWHDTERLSQARKRLNDLLEN
jgi:hypothetical protein